MKTAKFSNPVWPRNGNMGFLLGRGFDSFDFFEHVSNETAT